MTITEKTYYKKAISKPLNKAALMICAILFFFFPGFWIFFAVFAELAFITLTATNENFRRKVLTKLHQSEADQLVTLKKNIIRRLDDEHRKKYQNFINEIRQIEATFKDDSILKKGNLDILFTDDNLTQLSHLAWIYLNNLNSRQRLLNLIASEEKDIAQIDDSAPDFIENKLSRTENIAQAKNNLSEIDFEVTRLEQKIDLIKSNQVLSGSTELFWHEIDQLSKDADKNSCMVDDLQENAGKNLDPAIIAPQGITRGQSSRDNGNSSPFAKLSKKIKDRKQGIITSEDLENARKKKSRNSDMEIEE